MNLVIEKQLGNNCKGCEIIHMEVKCGTKPIARRSQVDILTKCRKGSSEEQRSSEKSLRRSLKVLQNPQTISVPEGGRLFKTVIFRITTWRLVVMCFDTSRFISMEGCAYGEQEFRKVTKHEL
jgi:hypothetical protein